MATLICQQIPQVKISSVANQAFAHHSGTTPVLTCPKTSSSKIIKNNYNNKKDKSVPINLWKTLHFEGVVKARPTFAVLRARDVGRSVQWLPTGRAWPPDARREAAVTPWSPLQWLGLHQ